MLLDFRGISQLGAETMGDKDHKLEAFLARPVLLNQGVLSSHDSLGVPLWSANFLTEWFKHDTIARKLDNFYSLSGTFCVRMTTNAMPFQTGLYYLNFYPQEMQTDTGRDNLSYSEWRTSFGISPLALVPNLSGYPGVYLNLADTSEQDLQVPYVGCWNSINLKKAVGNRLQLTCLSPLRGPTNNESVPYRIYAWMENITLHGADPWPLGTSVAFQGETSALDDLMKTAGVSQAQEALEMIGGTDISISGISGTVSKIADKFSTVPGVGEYAAPVAWLSGVISKTARMFGYSKPTDPRPSESVVQSPFREFGTCDGASGYMKLTVNRDQAVAIDPLGPTEEDEMAIKYILNRPQLLTLFQWAKNNAQGTLLWEQVLTPWRLYGYQSNYSLENRSAVTVVSNTYISYLSGLFMYWRGTINLTFTIVANKFYSGRLRVVYLLNTKGDDDTTAFDEPNKYSRVIDIRDATTIKVSFPFINVNHWACVNETYNEFIPAVKVYAETPLIGPETVANDVDIWVSLSTGDDFEFAGPRLDPYLNFLPITPGYQPSGRQAVDLSRVRPEGFTQDDTTENIIEEVEMAPKSAPHAAVVAHTQAIGDPVFSLRTLVKRPMPKCTFAMDAATYGLIVPFNNEVDVADDRVGTFLERVQVLYRFKRGGVRFAIRGLNRANNYQFKLVDIRGLDTRLKITKRVPNNIYQMTEKVGTPSIQFFQTIPTVADMPYREDLQGAICLEIPYYTLYSMMDAGPVLMPALPILNNFQPIKNGNLAIMWFNESAVTAATLYESAADDFNTGYLIGPPITFSLA